MPRESYFQSQAIAFLKTLPHSYWNVNHGSIYTGKGRPDIEGCWLLKNEGNGLYICFELKRPKKGKLSADQEAHGRMIRSAGGFWYAVTTLDQIKDILRDFGPLPEDEGRLLFE